MKYHMRDVVTGEEVEIDRPVALAPEFGKPITWKGRRLVRPVPEANHIQRPRVRENLRVVGWSQPPGVPGATAYLDPDTGRVSNDPSGVPMYDSERDLQATARLTGGEITHGRLMGGTE